jgi:mannose-6-phosphate isomerase-like protein (cupin superfamily)
MVGDGIAPLPPLPPHPHEASTETFYMLSGEVYCHVGDEETTLKAGHCGYAPPGVSHTVRNVGQEDLHAISVFNPPLEQ